MSSLPDHVFPDVHDDEPATDHHGRRRRAVAQAVAEAAALVRGGGTAVVAMRTFGPGCLAVALGGAFTPVDVRRLLRRRQELERVGYRDVVVDLGELHGCSTVLIRGLAQMRIRFLLVGARIEWHRLPTDLAGELTAGPTQAEVHDGDRAGVPETVPETVPDEG